jgi:hypothetical protein
MDARVRSNRRIGAPPFTAIPRRFCRIGAERLSGLPVKIALTPRRGASPGEKRDFLEGCGILRASKVAYSGHELWLHPFSSRQSKSGERAASDLDAF